ncbi:MAG: hypothetical protein DRJ96_01135 [Thermoprotei archaeon]|nr:hypothetical protein [Thermoproteales archaeon]RLE86234.1 MAG: hypothetical protein DRJ67_07735 [Thermoprotei archaeon]RLE98410.1 MAG: hypothetical protein DRJ96_01135 [Thermoprotei archaeon]
MSEEGEKLVEEARNALREFEDLLYELRDYERRRGEILRMFSTGQVTREVYEKLMGELRQKMTPLVKRYFELKSRLRSMESRLNVLMTRLRVEVKTSSESPFRLNYERDQRMRQLLNRAGGTLEDVQRALKSVGVERELRFLEVLLDSIRGEDIEAWRDVVREVVEEWSKARFSYASKVEEIERQMESLHDLLRELEVRFLVGEFDRAEYEARRAGLERKVGELQEQLERLQERLEDLDLVAARCRELLEGGSR